MIQADKKNKRTNIDKFIKSILEERQNLNEVSAKELLAYFDIIVPKKDVFSTSNFHNAILVNTDFPVVLKAVTRDTLHKTEYEYVKLNILNMHDLENNIKLMLKRASSCKHEIESFLIEEQVTTELPELVIGGLSDKTFGPMIMFGLGGIYLEILEEVNFRICPISYEDAQEMISKLKIKEIFNGFRGHKINSREKMIELLLKIGGEGGVIDSLGDNFSELDLNPVVLTSNHPVVLDAQLLLNFDL
jgi:acetyl-CoA synthetase (ADP-forming)